MKDYAKSYELNKCGLEILSETQYKDSFPSVYSVMIHIINVRMNSQAVDAYLDAKEHLTESDIRMRLWFNALLNSLKDAMVHLVAFTGKLKKKGSYGAKYYAEKVQKLLSTYTDVMQEDAEHNRKEEIL